MESISPSTLVARLTLTMYRPVPNLRAGILHSIICSPDKELVLDSGDRYVGHRQQPSAHVILNRQRKAERPLSVYRLLL